MDKEMKFSVKPDWNQLEEVNDRASEFLRAADLPPGTVDTYTMVICELVENGIKYGRASGEQADALEVSVDLSGQTITVHVKNPVGRSSRTHLRQLDQILQWIRGFQDPFEAYLERVKEISREPMNQGKSGLGIVRIAYEGHAAIDFVLGEDNTLSVSAVAKLNG